MSSNKSRQFKEYLISVRKKVSASIMSSPVWVIQKSGKRHYSKHSKRHWKRTSFGKGFEDHAKVDKVQRKRKKEWYNF